MFFFNKIKLIDTGLLNGSTDWHCHVLPGVDDGIKSMDESLEVLAYYEQLGVREMWLTPHIMEDIPNTTSDLRRRFDELRQRYQGPVKLNLAAENMMDNLFLERLEAGDLLPVGARGDHLLVEMSYYQPIIDLWGTLKRVQDAGYHPILAHPERYGFMEYEDYDRLKAMRIKFQLNIGALVGAFGKAAQEKSQILLTKGYYNFFGSDLHNLSAYQHAITSKSLKKDYKDHLWRIYNHID